MPMWWGHKMPLWGTGKWWEHKKPVGRQQEMKLERWVGGSVLNPFRQTVWAELKILVDYHYPYPPPPFYSVFKNKTKKQNKCKKSYPVYEADSTGRNGHSKLMVTHTYHQECPLLHESQCSSGCRAEESSGLMSSVLSGDSPMSQPWFFWLVVLILCQASVSSCKSEHWR